MRLIQNVMVIKEDYLKWFTSFLIESQLPLINLVEVVLILSKLSTREWTSYQIIRKFKIRKVYSSFRDNILGVHLADMQSLSKCNKGTKYLCAIYIFSKYVWIVPLKDKRGINIVNAFRKIISEGRRPNKYGLIKVLNFTIISLRGFCE